MLSPANRTSRYSGNILYSLVIITLVTLSFLASACVANESIQPSLQAQHPTDLTQVSLEDLMNMRVTTASKKPQKISQTPAAVFVITQEDIHNYGYRTLSEALRRVIGLYTSSDRNYDYLGVRGYGRPGDLNTRVLLLIDGHKVNDPLYDMAFIGEDLPLDIDSVERIEIVKGPGSALWGSNALLAVINLITRKAADIRGSHFEQDAGANARTKSFFEFGSKSLDGLQVAGSYSTMRSDGEGSIYFPEFNTPDTNGGIATNIDGESADRGYVTASYKGLTLMLNAGSRTKTVPTAAYQALFDDSRDFTIDERRFAELSYEQHVSHRNNGTFFARVYADDSTFRCSLPMYYEPLSTNMIYRDYGRSEWYGTELRYSQSISPKLAAVFGIEYQKIRDMHQKSWVASPMYIPTFDVHSSFNLFSSYAQAEYQINDLFRLVSGIRVDDYSTFGKAWSPRLALLYAPKNGTTLKALYGRAFRGPNGYERKNYGDPDWANPADLSPEQITTTEFVWEQELAANSRLVTSVFRFDLDNIINEVESEEGSVVFENSGAARSEGLEMQVESRYADGTSNYFGFTIIDGKDTTTDQRVVNSPRCLINAGACIPIFSNRYYLTPELQIVGSRRTLAGNTIGPSAVANLMLGTKNSAKFDVSLGIYNAFNTATYSPGAAEHIQDRIPLDGRTFRLQTSYRF